MVMPKDLKDAKSIRLKISYFSRQNISHQADESKNVYQVLHYIEAIEICC